MESQAVEEPDFGPGTCGCNTIRVPQSGQSEAAADPRFD
jgi:hypothetical protein